MRSIAGAPERVGDLLVCVCCGSFDVEAVRLGDAPRVARAHSPEPHAVADCGWVSRVLIYDGHSNRLLARGFRGARPGRPGSRSVHTTSLEVAEPTLPLLRTRVYLDERLSRGTQRKRSSRAASGGFGQRTNPSSVENLG
jgi:hypothetical protein